MKSHGLTEPVKRFSRNTSHETQPRTHATRLDSPFHQKSREERCAAGVASSYHFPTTLKRGTVCCWWPASSYAPPPNPPQRPPPTHHKPDQEENGMLLLDRFLSDTQSCPKNHRRPANTSTARVRPRGTPYCAPASTVSSPAPNPGSAFTSSACDM